jgi:phage shock protein C
VAERLYRSSSDRVIAGVAGGLAVYFNLDPSLIRIAWVLLALFSGGFFILVYIVMMIVVPLPPVGWVPRPRDNDAWAPGGGPGAAGPAGDPSMGWAPPPEGWPTPPSGWTTPPPPVPAFRAGSAGLVAGGVLIALGAWFLVDDYIHIDWSIAWPIAIIVAGGLLLAGALRQRG